MPIPLDRNDGHAERLGNLGFPQPAEESQFHDPSGPGIYRLQCRKRCVESDQILAGREDVPTVEVRQRDPLLLASPLVGGLGAGVVDQNPPHRLSRNGEKVCSILIGDRSVSEETDAELVHQGVGFKRMIPTFALHEMCSDLAQFRLDDGKEMVARIRIPLPPPIEPLRDLFVACHRASA